MGSNLVVLAEDDGVGKREEDLRIRIERSAMLSGLQRFIVAGGEGRNGKRWR